MKDLLVPAHLDTVQEQKIHALEQQLKCRIVPLESRPQYANLSVEQYARLQSCEGMLGVALVAYEPETTFRVAKSSEAQLKRLRQWEKECGQVLVAYEQVVADIQTGTELPSGFEEVKLSDQQFEALQKVESEMGFILMACKPQKKK
jgi:hypothetical protein